MSGMLPGLPLTVGSNIVIEKGSQLQAEVETFTSEAGT